MEVDASECTAIFAAPQNNKRIQIFSSSELLAMIQLN